MDDGLYRFLKWTAFGMAGAWIGWSIYDSFVEGREPGDTAFLAGETLFEDGHYERALAEYDLALEQMPGHIHALRAKGRTLMQLERFNAALLQFDEAIALAPDFGPTYANRGILHDRVGQYEKAVADYERALELEPTLADGPNWLTRFLRLQPEKPPSIADRKEYLLEQLAKPPGERLLRVPDIDREQRPYKQ